MKVSDSSWEDTQTSEWRNLFGGGSGTGFRSIGRSALFRSFVIVLSDGIPHDERVVQAWVQIWKEEVLVASALVSVPIQVA